MMQTFGDFALFCIIGFLALITYYISMGFLQNFVKDDEGRKKLGLSLLFGFIAITLAFIAGIVFQYFTKTKPKLEEVSEVVYDNGYSDGYNDGFADTYKQAYFDGYIDGSENHDYNPDYECHVHSGS